MASQPDTTELPEAFGRYRVTSRLATYDESGVYHALDPLLERRLVVKVFALDGITEAAASHVRTVFFDEIRRIGTLAHPGLVTIFDAGETPAGLFFAAEFVDGTTLSEWLREHPECPVVERASIITQIAEVLEYVHARGHAHLRLRLSNVFVTADGVLRVAGLGVMPVLAALREARGAGDAASTPAPGADAREDVLALGEMTASLLAADERDEAVERVLAQATASDPADRFSSAGPFADALLEALGLSDLHVRVAWQVARSGGAFADEPTLGPVVLSPLDATRLPDETQLGAATVLRKPDARS